MISGKEGSSVKLGNGTEVTYVNGFGGDWLWDDEDPWGKKEGALGGGRAQEWSKRSGEDWVWGVDRVRGVSLCFSLTLFALKRYVADLSSLWFSLQVNLGMFPLSQDVGALLCTSDRQAKLA